MFSKNNLLFLTIILICSNMLNSETYRTYRKKRYKESSPSLCTNAEDCKDLNNNCQCWCSVKGGPRNKKPSDRPVYVDPDINGVHCYCKEWDLKNFPRTKQSK